MNIPVNDVACIVADAHLVSELSFEAGWRVSGFAPCWSRQYTNLSQPRRGLC